MKRESSLQQGLFGRGVHAPDVKSCIYLDSTCTGCQVADATDLVGIPGAVAREERARDRCIDTRLICPRS